MPIPHLGARSNALLALPPLSPLAGFSFDLHVLAMPPAFNLSQDQTLQLIFIDPSGRSLRVIFNEGCPGDRRSSSDGRSVARPQRGEQHSRFGLTYREASVLLKGKKILHETFSTPGRCEPRCTISTGTAGVVNACGVSSSWQPRIVSRLPNCSLVKDD